MTRPLTLRGSFRHASAESRISFRSASTKGNHSAKLIFRFRYASAKPPILCLSVSTEGDRSATFLPLFRRVSIFLPIRFHCSIAFRQTHFPLPLRFRASLDFVPFRVHGSTYFRDDYTRVQTNKKYHLYTFCVF